MQKTIKSLQRLENLGNEVLKNNVEKEHFEKLRDIVEDLIIQGYDELEEHYENFVENMEDEYEPDFWEMYDNIRLIE